MEGPIRGKGPDDVDMVVVRENNEDLYVGAGGFTRKGTPEEVAIQTSINTRAGVERTHSIRVRPGSAPGARPARFEAFPRPIASRAIARQVTLVAKTNVLTFAHDLWMRAFTEVAREYPEIKSDYQHVDACCMRMVTSPERFDVIVTTNMFGDIITDLGAVLQGGMGLAASGNLNPERDISQHVRADPRFGPRHRRQRGGQSAGGDPVGRDDARSSGPASGAERIRAAVRKRADVRLAPDSRSAAGTHRNRPGRLAPFATPLLASQVRQRGLAVAAKVSYNRTVVVLGRSSSIRRSDADARNRAQKASKPDDKSGSNRVIWLLREVAEPRRCPIARCPREF